MAKTLAEINAILGPTDAADLTAIIKAVKDAVTASYDDIVAVVTAERDAALTKLADIEAKLNDPDATKDDVKEEHEKTEKQRRKRQLDDELDKLDEERAKKQAELDELDKVKGDGKSEVKKKP